MFIVLVLLSPTYFVIVSLFFFFFLMIRRPPRSTRTDTLFPYTTLFRSTDDDRRVAADALRLTRRIAAQPALAPYQPEEYLPGPQFQSDDELATAAGAIGRSEERRVGKECVSTCRSRWSPYP